MHTTPHFKRNKLIMCNLAKNLPQKLLHLKNLEFLCFVEAGPTQAQPNVDVYENIIYFIGESTNSKKISLYQLTVKPWESNDDSLSLTQININLDFGIYRKDQIKKVQLVMLSKKRHCLLLIQFTNNILVF